MEPVSPICARGSTTGTKCLYRLVDPILGIYHFIVRHFSRYSILPCHYVGEAENENTGDDVKEITKCQDTHKLVEIISFSREPDDQTEVANDAEKSNKNLKCGGYC